MHLWVVLASVCFCVDAQVSSDSGTPNVSAIVNNNNGDTTTTAWIKNPAHAAIIGASAGAAGLAATGALVGTLIANRHKFDNNQPATAPPLVYTTSFAIRAREATYDGSSGSLESGSNDGSLKLWPLWLLLGACLCCAALGAIAWMCMSSKKRGKRGRSMGQDIPRQTQPSYMPVPTQPAYVPAQNYIVQPASYTVVEPVSYSVPTVQSFAAPTSYATPTSYASPYYSNAGYLGTTTSFAAPTTSYPTTGYSGAYSSPTTGYSGGYGYPGTVL